jgi:voltage-gated potassium channel
MLLGLIKPFRQSRHHVKGTSTGLHLIRMLLILLMVLILHSIAMIYFEGLSLGDSIWLTMTSATTVGYGDLSAKTFAGRFSTIILLYVGGIAILAQVAAMYFEYRSEIRENMLTGNWRWKMKNHIVFLNCPHEVGEEYFYKAISGMRRSGASTAKTPIIIVSDKFDDGISSRLRNLNVVHISKPIMNLETLNAANIREASTIIVLSTDRFNPISDSVNFELVDRLRDMGVKGRIIAEVAQDEHRARLKKVGANNVLRPIRTYPELLMRAILAPGSEQVIETLFDSFGEECIRYEVEIECSWFEIIEKLSSKDLGLPIAYADIDGNVFTNPSSKKMVKTTALFVIVNEGEAKKGKEIEKLLKSSLS